MLIVGESINGTIEKVGKAISSRDHAFIEGLAREQMERGAQMLDVNAGIDRFGAVEFKAQHTARIADIKARGDLGLLFAVPGEMDAQTATFLRYTCSGVVETWVEDGYQFLRVSKTPSGRASEPGVVEVTTERPFIKIR